MFRFSKFSKAFWFSGGFIAGFTLISIGHAALPSRPTLQTTRALPAGSMVSEINSSKVTSPDFDSDFKGLNHLEGKYAENWDQQQRIRAAVTNQKVQYRPTAARQTTLPKKKIRRSY